MAFTRSYEGDENKLVTVRDALLDWYAHNRRTLPWRSCSDPYAIVVSEIMLQQTGVDRVIPKFQAFLERFPTFSALASAPRDEVIRMWSGLGYNRRAVQLHLLAQTVVARYAGRLPRTPSELRGLPGVGPYTAGALASFVHGDDAPALDTNAGRVLGRIFFGRAERDLKKLVPLAERIMPRGRSADFNQSLMDFASLHCTLSRPRCLLCPVLDWCLAAPYAQRGDLVERRVAEQSEPYMTSSRYYRGRVVALLGSLQEGEAKGLDEIERGLILVDAEGRPGVRDRSWLQKTIAGLVRDGLVAEDVREGATEYRLAR